MLNGSLHQSEHNKDFMFGPSKTLSIKVAQFFISASYKLNCLSIALVVERLIFKKSHCITGGECKTVDFVNVTSHYMYVAEYQFRRFKVLALEVNSIVIYHMWCDQAKSV